MKNITLCLLIFVTFQVFGQNKEDNNGFKDLSYEDKIAEKSCIYLSEMDSISDPKQAVIKCIIKAQNKVHEEDVDKKYKRDYTVEGIRGLFKKVTDLLIENCEVVSKSE
ncbi:hypothetical protein NO995_10190 [Aestuariibaculum sp. M13]|uniref:hypothetical protein n=1 Tax=Aestuariibaculum sp. M13 TaxID=2967132 RepID=UPI002159CB96|nr:hypothetical protein [Aestuariibaculum sp. M13]MCR8668052.1 hypothetical protein [Aestuariibaculum sp. M13]